jgi:hypothetical protein
MDKIQSREWDSEKSGAGWKKKPIVSDGGWGTSPSSTTTAYGGLGRGTSPRGRGRGRGRGGDTSMTGSRGINKKTIEVESTAGEVPSSDWPPTADDWPLVTDLARPSEGETENQEAAW